MKKSLFLFLVVLLVLQLFSCNRGDNSDSSENMEEYNSSLSSSGEDKEVPRLVDFIIRDNGKVYGRGNNNYYVLGIDDKNYIDKWVEIPLSERIIKVCYNTYNAFFITENRNIYYTGLKLEYLSSSVFLDIGVGHSDDIFVKAPQLMKLDSVNEKIVDIDYTYGSSSATIMMISETGKAYVLESSREVVEIEFPEKIISGQMGIVEYWFLSETGNLYSLEATDAEGQVFSENPKPELRAENVVYYNANVRTIHYINDKGELYGAGIDDRCFGFIPENFIDRDFRQPVKWQHNFQMVELPERVRFTFKYTDGFMCAVGESGRVYVCEHEDKNLFTKKEKIEDARLMTYSGWDIENVDEIEEFWFNDSYILKIKRNGSDWEYCYIFNQPEGLECFKFYSVNEIYK